MEEDLRKAIAERLPEDFTLESLIVRESVCKGYASKSSQTGQPPGRTTYSVETIFINGKYGRSVWSVTIDEKVHKIKL